VNTNTPPLGAVLLFEIIIFLINNPLVMSPDVLLSACLYIDIANIRIFKLINKFIFICLLTLDSVYLHKQSIINVLIE